MGFKSLTRSVPQRLGNIPLRVVLVVPFVIQIVGAVGLVGYLSFRNGYQAVNNVASQLRQEISDRIKDRVTTYLTTPYLINQLTQNGINSGQLTITNRQHLGRYFWQNAQSFDGVASIYFGSQQGDYTGTRLTDTGRVNIDLQKISADNDLYEYATDQQGNPTKLVQVFDVVPSYDFRHDPWYQVAILKKKAVWTPIYAWESSGPPDISIDAVRPVYDISGQLKGVLGTSLTLSEMSEFLSRLKIGKSGKTFIIERSGDVVATSTAEAPFIKSPDGKEFKRLNATKSQEPLIRLTSEYLMAHFGQLTNIQSSQQLEFKIHHERQFLQITPLNDDRGINWLIVVVVPEADFMEQINANTQTTVLLCLAALGVAIIIGILTSRWIVKPIWQLKEAAISLSEGQFDQTINLERSDELGILAKAFNRMAVQLEESFTTLEVKNAELQQLDQLKNEFLANTSHELRTPLNGIIGIAESLIDGVAGPLPSSATSNLTMIVSAGRRLSNLVNDILDFSKLRHKTIELQLKPVGVREVVDVVITLSQPLIGNKPLQLTNLISSDTPLIQADENRLQQIFYNLIGNAIKFTDTGKIEVSAKVITAHPQTGLNGGEDGEKPQITHLQNLAITVADTGIGIPADKIERIFQSFEQVDGSTAREYGGTGLGLAITKQLIELQGGEISLTSKVGEGSQFTFTLPLYPEPVESGNRISIPEQLPTQSIASPQSIEDETLITTAALNANSGQFKILIVDDEPINLQVLANSLSLENYAITQTNNGSEALAIIESGFQPDLILLDVMMPRMTGYEVCEKLRERFLAIELPIVMLTAKNQVADLVEGFKVGANDYLTKPFNKNELLARIKTHIRLAKINAAYGRFVPHDFLKFLERESIVDVQLGDHVKKEMTIMFSDIRSFTTLSEEMSPEENFNFLNSYLSQVSPIIRDHNGFIDKYIGDAVMALFPESANDAVASAIAMQKQVAYYNNYRQKCGYSSIAIGIGLHTGSLMLGTIGSQERMESTVIADAVNLASRLEGLTKLYGAGILVSRQTLFSIDEPERYSYRFLDRVKVKGKKAPVAVFEVYNGDDPTLEQLKTQTKSNFEKAVFLYCRQDFTQAQQIFQEILQINPQDKAAILYVKRCEQYQKYGVTEEWEGIELLTTK